MAIVLDLAVLALTVVVLSSLALLAWTIGVGATQGMEAQQLRIATARGAVRTLHERLERIPEATRE